jgi:hypothetical protein
VLALALLTGTAAAAAAVPPKARKWRLLSVMLAHPFRLGQRWLIVAKPACPLGALRDALLEGHAAVRGAAWSSWVVREVQHLVNLVVGPLDNVAAHW